LSEAELSAAINKMLENDVFDLQAGGLESLSRMELSVMECKVIL